MWDDKRRQIIIQIVTQRQSKYILVQDKVLGNVIVLHPPPLKGTSEQFATDPPFLDFLDFRRGGDLYKIQNRAAPAASFSSKPFLLSDFQIRIVCPKYFVCQSISKRYPHDIIYQKITSKLFQNYDSKHELTMRLRLLRVK